MQARQPTPAEKLAAAARTLVIGHRGAAAHAPENTLASFRLALEAGADLVELDYFHTSDGVPVVLHDERLDRTTNAAEVFGPERGRQPPSAFTLSELRRLDAGGWFSPRFRGEGIPTLAEALEVIQPRAMTYIEHKGGDAETLVRLLEGEEVLEAVAVLSFDWDFLADCRRLAPRLSLGALGKGELRGEQLDQMLASGARIVGWQAGDLAGADVALIHQRGLRTWVYTVNDEAQARALVARGIDGIVTDDPAWLRRLVPAERP